VREREQSQWRAACANHRRQDRPSRGERRRGGWRVVSRHRINNA
jgi:hypothetical protein